MALAKSPEDSKFDEFDLPCFSSAECPKHLFCIQGICHLWPDDRSLDRESSVDDETIKNGFPRSIISFFSLFCTLILIMACICGCIRCILHRLFRQSGSISSSSTYPSSRSMRSAHNEMILMQPNSQLTPAPGVFPVPMYAEYPRSITGHEYTNLTDGPSKIVATSDEEDDPPPPYSQVCPSPLRGNEK